MRAFVISRIGFKFRYYWLLALVPVAFAGWYLISRQDSRPVRLLPYYNDKRVKGNEAHAVPGFTFTDQNGRRVTESNVSGKIYIAEFFFTTCQSICPVMNDNLSRIHSTIRDPRVLILSHTVDPETDSVPVLKRYAERRHAEDDRWLFLTGDKRQLYSMARRGYLLGDAEPLPAMPPDSHRDRQTGARVEDDFLHTQNFALVDWARRIRGIYDGTDSLEVVRLQQDLRLLIKELDAHATPD
jgi:protein SCO1